MINKPPSALLLPDNPHSSSNDDLLDWAPIGTEFARRVRRIDATRGLVIGLFGSWGSPGKGRGTLTLAEIGLLPFDLPAVKRKRVTADFAGGSTSSDGGLDIMD